MARREGEWRNEGYGNQYDPEDPVQVTFRTDNGPQRRAAFDSGRDAARSVIPTIRRDVSEWPNLYSDATTEITEYEPYVPRVSNYETDFPRTNGGTSTIEGTGLEQRQSIASHFGLPSNPRNPRKREQQKARQRTRARRQ